MLLYKINVLAEIVYTQSNFIPLRISFGSEISNIGINRLTWLIKLLFYQIVFVKENQIEQGNLQSNNQFFHPNYECNCDSKRSKQIW